VGGEELEVETNGVVDAGQQAGEAECAHRRSEGAEAVVGGEELEEETNRVVDAGQEAGQAGTDSSVANKSRRKRRPTK
jgi:hypothetical protein